MRSLLRLTALSFVLFATLRAEEPRKDNTPLPGQRVFTSGHSLIMFVPPILEEIAQKAGVTNHVQAGRQMIGGSYVYQHWDLADAKNLVKPALKTGQVDVLMLSPIYLPDDGIEKLAALGLKHRPDLRVTVQEFWIPYEDPTVLRAGAGPRVVERDSRTMAGLREMHAAYFQSMDGHVRALNRKFGKDALFVVPVGQAVMALRGKIIEGQAPGVRKQSELFRDALGHAGEVVQVLSAYCHFAVIYRRSPVGLPVPMILAKRPEAEKLNRLLQDLAWDAVTQHPLSGVTATPASSQETK